MKSYRDLEIFREARRLAIEVHAMTLKLPRFELYEEGSQVRRSSKSIASMIVEGYARKRYKAEFVKFLVYAHSECDETLLHLDFLIETKSVGHENDIDIRDLKQSYERLSRRINKFIKWMDNHFIAPKKSNEPGKEPTNNDE